MKHIFTMKYTNTRNYCKLLVATLTLLGILCAEQVFAEDHDYGTGEKMYINRHPESWSGFNDGVGSGTHIFAYFYRGGGGNWSSEATVSDISPDILEVTVPTGKWSNVIIIRKSNATADWSYELGRTGDIDLSSYCNYLHNFKQSNTDKQWLVLEASRTFDGDEDLMYFNKYPSNWSGFSNPDGYHIFVFFFNATGSGWSNEATEPNSDGILQVTPPAGKWTHMMITRQSGALPASWDNVWDYGKDKTTEIPLSKYSNYLHNYCKNNGGCSENWHWVSTSEAPTSDLAGLNGGRIVREDLPVCTQAFDNNDPLSLSSLLRADGKDYDYPDPHVWFIWQNDHWIPLRNNWANFWVPLVNAPHSYYFLWSNDDDNKARFLHVQKTSCPINCKITSFEYVLTPVNVNDSTFAIEGIVAFTQQAGDLVISYLGSEQRFTAPESPQVFSLKGLKAEFGSVAERTHTLRALFVESSESPTDSLVVAPLVESGIVVYDSKDDEDHYTPSRKSYPHDKSVVLTPHVSVAAADSFAWTDKNGRLLKNGHSGDDCTYTILSGRTDLYDLTYDHDDLLFYYTEFNNPPAVEDNMMGNGGYETTTLADDNVATSPYRLTSGYKYTGVWGGVTSKSNVYDNGYGGENALFGVTTNPNIFWERFAHLSPKDGSYMAVFDGDSGEQIAWQASTSDNPNLKLKQGTTYMFSFWVANVNNFGEMVTRDTKNNAILQFKIRYKDKNDEWHERFLGEETDLNDDEYFNNLWHQNSATFTSDYDADEVIISVVDKNSTGMRIGNDFALDDIRFRAVSVRSATIRARELFSLDYKEPQSDPVNLKVEWLTTPACGLDTCTMRVSFRYPNTTTHNILLTLTDLTEGGYGTIVSGGTLSKTPIAGNPDSTDYVGIFTSRSDDGKRIPGAIYKAGITADAKTHNLKAKLTVLDSKSVDHGGETTKTADAPGVPALTIKKANIVNPACDGTTYGWDIDVDYTALTGTELKFYIDDVEKAKRTISYNKDLQSITGVTISGLTADGKPHTLRVATGHTLDCVPTTKKIAPKGNLLTEFYVEAQPVDCDVTTYKLEGHWTVTKPSTSVFDTLIIKENGVIIYKDTVRGASADATSATGTKVFDGVYTIGADHKTYTAYLKERSGCPVTTAAPYSDPITPKMAFDGDVSFEDISCNTMTYTLIVPIKYTNQHGRMWAYIDKGTTSEIKQEITDLAGYKSATGYTGYAEDASERKTLVKFTGLTGDYAAHTVSVECDGALSCHLTGGKAKGYTAPNIPTMTVSYYNKPDSILPCNQTTYTLSGTIRYRNFDESTIRVWVDADSYAAAAKNKRQEYAITPNSTEVLSLPFAIDNVPADSADHYLHVESAGRGAACPYTSEAIRAPFSPKIDEVYFTGNPATLACGTAAPYYTAVVNVRTTNHCKARLTVEYPGGATETKTVTSDVTTFTFPTHPIDGSTQAVKVWFDYVHAKRSECETSSSFTAPVLPISSVSSISVTPAITACDEDTVSLSFDLNYTNQDGTLTVWVDDDHKAEKTIEYDHHNSSTSHTKNITLNGLPADGATHTLYYNFASANSCHNQAVPLAAFPRTPMITGVTTRVPEKINCSDASYKDTVDVAFKWTDDEILVVEYKDKSRTVHTEEVSLSGKSSPCRIIVTMDKKDGYAKDTVYVYFKGSGFSGCHEKGLHTKIFSTPSSSSVKGNFDVTVTDRSSCDNLLYDLSGKIEFTDADGDLIIECEGKDPIVNTSGSYTSPVSFKFEGLTTEAVGKTITTYFSNQTKCKSNSKEYNSPSIPSYSVSGMSFSALVCDDTLSTLSFTLSHIKQTGTLKVWVDGLEKETVTYTSGAAATNQVITFDGVRADSLTHTLHVQFEGGMCSTERTFTTPNAPYSPKVTGMSSALKTAPCTSDKYTQTVTFTVGNSQNKKVTVMCKGQTVTATSHNGVNTIDIPNIPRTLSNLEDDSIVIFFPSADICSPRRKITYIEYPKPELVEINISDEQGTIACGAASYSLIGNIRYTNLDSKPQVWLDSKESEAVTLETATLKSKDTLTIAISGITVPTDGKLHTLHVKAGGWTASCSISDNFTAKWRPLITNVTAVQASEYAHCDGKYSVTGRVSFSQSNAKTLIIEYTDKDGIAHTKEYATSSSDTYKDYEITGLDHLGAHRDTIKAYFEGTGICNYDAQTEPYTTPVVKTITLGAITSNDVVCGESSFSISVPVSSNVAGETIILSDGYGHTKSVTSSTSTVTYTMDGFTAAGSITAQFEGVACSKTAPQSFANVPLKPIPTFSLDPIETKCYPATSFDVTYDHTNADKLYYKVTQGETEKKGWTEVTVDATKTFTISTSSWADGAYTVETYVKSAVGCESATPHPTATLTINKKPSLELASIDNVCAGKSGVSTAVTLKDGATKYDYDVYKNDEVMSAQHKSGQTASSINLTTSTWEPATYKIQVTAYSSVDCPSDPVEVSFVIHPNPTITSLTDKVTVCEKTDHTASFAYEMSSVADEYDYYLEGTGIHKENQSVGAGGKGNIVFDPSSLSDGAYTLHVTARNSSTGCESAESTASLVINNQPELSFASIAAKCYPADEFEVKYTPSADAISFTYVVMKGSTEKQGEKTITVDASKKFTLNTSGWAAGTYTINATAKSSKNCYSEEATINFIINEQPEAGITSVESKCVYDGPAKVVYTASANATKYSYTIYEGSTEKKNVTNQTISNPKEFMIDIASLGAGSYTLHLTTWAGDCPSVEATKDFTVYPRPTLTLDPAYTTSAGVKVCYPVAKVEIPYTSTDADTYTYVLTVGSSTRTDTKSASPSGGNIEVNTAGLPAGDYALSVTATSEKGCVTAAAQTTVIKIKPQPSLELTDIDDVCEGTSGVSTTVTLKTGATKYNCDVLKNGVVMPAQHKENQTSASISLSTGSWDPDTYTVQVTAISGDDCGSEMAEVSFVINPNPDITELTVSQTICEKEDAVSYDFTITGAKTYSYSVVGTEIAGMDITVPDGGSGTISFDPSELSDGNYTLQVIAKSELGCTTTRTAALKISNKPTVSLTPTTNICYGDPAGLDFNYTVSADAKNYYLYLRQADRSKSYGGCDNFDLPTMNEGTIHYDSFSPFASPLSGGDYIAVMWVKNSAGCVSDSVVVPFTIYPIAGIEIYMVASMCATKPLSTVFYNIHSAESFRYKIKGVTEWSGPQTPSTEDLKHFEFNISSLDPGNYTLQLQAYNDNCGYSNIVESPFTIYPLPTLDLDVPATGVNVCYPVSQVDIPYTSTDAKKYTYELTVGSDKRTATKSASSSGKIEVVTDGLPAGDYALSVTAVSEHDCEIAAAQTTTIHINPRPTFTFKPGEVRDCHPSTSINVGYTSTNAKTYSYTLTLEGESSSALAEDNLTASADGVIALNTTGFAAGTYDLVVTTTSKDGCDMLASVSRKVIIQAKPTVTINSVESHCAGNATINVSYSTTNATTYYYEVLDTDLKGHADTEDGTHSFTIDISTLTAKTYTLRMKATSGTCESVVDEKLFTIHPIPAVTFDTPAPIRSDVSSVDVTIHLTDASHYDFDFNYLPKTHQHNENVSESETTVTINTSGLGEGTYTLYVTPKNTTTGCVGDTKSVNIVINNKPSINFTEPMAVCAGTTAIDIAYGKSADAEKLTYSIMKGSTTIVPLTDSILASHPSPMTFDITGWDYGTYTLTGKVSYEALDHSIVEGDESSVDFTILANLSVASVSQPVTYIGCGESYSATIIVNLLNAAGRTIHAKYVDDNTEYTPSRSTSVGDETATFVLSGLKDTDHGSHSVSIYVDGYESCGITATYTEPTLKTLILGAPTLNEVHCGDDAFSISGTLTSNFAGETVIISDGNGHFDNVTTIAGGVPYNITGLTASGTITAKFAGYDCSETAPQSYTVTTLRPIPTLDLNDIDAQCYPADAFVIAYNHTDAKDIKYTVKQGETVKQTETTVAVNTAKQFTINTSGWNADTYTIDAYAVSAGNCTSSHLQKTFTINPKPSISIDSLANACDDKTTASLHFTTTDATTYNYYIVGKTTLLDAAPTAAADQTIDLDISMLDAGTYTLKMVANSATCVSDTIEYNKLVIHPLPTLSFGAIADACYPTEGITVAYTASNTKIFHYIVKQDATVKTSGDVTVATPHTFTINTEGWADGTYTLYATATSDKECTAEASSVSFKILPKPEVNAISMESKCISESSAILTFTTSNATQYQYYIDSNTPSDKEDLSGTGEHDIDIDISGLSVGEHTIHVIAHSSSCYSETAQATFQVYPLPTFTFKQASAHDCYPSTSISVEYTSSDVDTYIYMLTKDGIGSPTLTSPSLTAAANGNGTITLNTTGLSAGNYTLQVTAQSKYGCNLAATATLPVTIQDKPTVTINSVESHCAGNATINVSYSTTNATTYYYEVLDTDLKGHADTEDGTHSFIIDISTLTAKTYTLRMKATSGTCESVVDEKLFTIHPIPAVTFDTPAPIRSDVSSVDVTIHLTDATNYDFDFNYLPKTHQHNENVSATDTTITINTGGLGEGTYTLYVTPKNTTTGCVGDTKSVNIVINNKPSINFTEPAAVCVGTNSLDIEYITSLDAKQFTYAITTKAGAPKQATTTVNLSDYPSSQAIDISTWEYGTYTLTGHVSYTTGATTVTGDDTSVDFTILAHPTVETISQPIDFIGCEESYDVTIVINLFNNAGRDILARYTDNGGIHTTLPVHTSVGDQTATIVLSDLTDTDHTTAHEVLVYVDGFESCGYTANYNDPKLKTITFVEVNPQPKACGDDIYTVTGTVKANCDEGTIVVEYDATHKQEVAASTSGKPFMISGIPEAGVTQLKAYYLGKTCGYVYADYSEPVKPQASIAATPPTLACDVTSFDLPFTLNYTYQEAGTLTVWVDATHKKTFHSSAGGYLANNATAQTLTDAIIGLPADGSTGHKLYYAFDGTHSCTDSINLAAFPRTPRITSVTPGNIPSVVPGLTGTYEPTFTVTYEYTDGETLMLDYQTADGTWHSVSSAPATMSGASSYTFTGLTFDDVAMSGRTVRVYFEGLTCRYEQPYTTPSNSSITFQTLTITNTSSCGSLLYNLSGTVSYTGTSVGNLVVELDAMHRCTIPELLCAADQPLPFLIRDIDVPVPATGSQLDAYFTNTSDNRAHSDLFYEPVIPAVDALNIEYGTPACDAVVTTLDFDIHYIKQKGTLTAWVDTQAPQTVTYTSIDVDAPDVVHVQLDNIPADSMQHRLYVSFDGDHSCADQSFPLPHAPFSPRIHSYQTDTSGIACGKDTYDVTVAFRTDNHQGRPVTVACRTQQQTITATDGLMAVTFTDIERTSDNSSDDYVEIYFADATYCTTPAHVSYDEPALPAISIANPVFVTPTCDSVTTTLTFDLSYTRQTGDLKIRVDDLPEQLVTYVRYADAPKQITGLAIPNIPADGQTHTLYVRFDNSAACADQINLTAPLQPVIQSVSATPSKTYINCGQSYEVTIPITFVNGGKTLYATYTDGGTPHTISATTVHGQTSHTFTLENLSDTDHGTHDVHIYFEDMSTCEAIATYTEPIMNVITPAFAVTTSANPCGMVDYTISGQIEFNHADNDLIVEFDEDHRQTYTNPVSPLQFSIANITTAGTGLTVKAYFANVGDDTNNCSTVESAPFDSPEVASLSAEITSIDTIFSCSDKEYVVRLDIQSENQHGTGVVLDCTTDGGERTVLTYSGSFNGTDSFTIALPSKDETHYVRVRYDDSDCEENLIGTLIHVNPYVKPEPVIKLDTIERLCNSETELALPFTLVQGAINQATLTLLDRNGQAVVDAEALTNEQDTLFRYTLPEKLEAGIYNATITAQDTLGCETIQTMPIEFAIEGLLRSKWTDVLLVDNSSGLYTEYQWYEEGTLLEGQQGQTIYLPEGMMGKSYYCRLTTADGLQIYTCAADFGDIPRAADDPRNQDLLNEIAVTPNRVIQGGLVRITQTLTEPLQIILYSATGKRIEEHTQTDEAGWINMPSIQGIYLVRVEGQSGMTTAKIVVY